MLYAGGDVNDSSGMNMKERFIRILKLLSTSLSNPFTHFVGLHQTGIAFNVSRIVYTSAEKMALE